MLRLWGLWGRRGAKERHSRGKCLFIDVPKFLGVTNRISPHKQFRHIKNTMKSQSSLVLALALLLPRSNSYYVSPLSVSRLPRRVGLPHAPFTSVRVPSVRHALPETTEEADDVLSKNGWGGLFAPEEPENEELMSDSPFVLAIDEEISELNSISDGLAGLLNPAKCVNLEQQIVGLKMDIMELTKEAVEEDWLVVRSMSEEEVSVFT